jgi:Uma2 family endonuclease
MASERKPQYTPDEYLALERAAEFKSEYLDGYIVAMVGASEAHNLITTNVTAELRTQLRERDCRVYASDMRVDLRERNLFAYPDVVVICGQPQFPDARRDNLRNPMVIVEVLSPSTEGYDRGIKFIKYRRIESLQEYVLISQDEARIERFVRQVGGDWLMSEAAGISSAIKLTTIGCELKLSEVYDKVELPH